MLPADAVLPVRAARTIVAPATAAGRAAVAILRVSGPEAAAVCRALTGRPPPPPRRATLRRLIDPQDGAGLDRGLVLWFPAGSSLTGEDLLELHHHGGTAVGAALLGAARRLPGVRLAEPGELTRRAFAAGRLDLAQVEAVADLIDATTAAQARQAARQLEGALGAACARIAGRLAEALARLEAELDFAPDHDLGDGALPEITPALDQAERELEQLLHDAGCGERLREGLTVAVIGSPNAGKSSLVNRLARREVAIVTPWAGTTRDVLEVALDLGGVPVRLLDTAGLRETEDPVEAEGVARARQRAALADLRLIVVDATCPQVPESAGAAMIVLSKIDVAGARARSSGPPDALPISCVTGEGLDRLVRELCLWARRLAGDGSALVAHERQREALEEALDALRRLAGLRAAAGEPVLLAEELRAALQAVGRVTGKVGAEALLARIFARFCIGK